MRAQYHAVQYSTVAYSTVQYGTVEYSTVAYSTVQVRYSRVPEQYTSSWQVHCILQKRPLTHPACVLCILAKTSIFLVRGLILSMREYI